jgi:ABC-type branched-subunit amino acid transport system substrate-binding protein
LIGYPLIPPPSAAQAPGDSQSALYQKQLEMAVKEVKDYSSLELLLREHPNHALTPFLLYRMAETASETGRSGLAEAHLRTILNQYPDSNVADAAKSLLSSLHSRSNVSGHSVGVLLPLTGKFSKFGSQARQAIELAFEGKADSLVFEDSGDTAEQASQALDRLIVDKQVVAVIGPLLSKGIEQLSQRAQELGVPILTLAQQSGVPGDYVFRASLSPKQQVNEIASYTVNQLEFKKFAIVYPQGRFGQEYADAFWDSIEALGGEITEIESYSSHETDFREVVDRSVSLYYKDARARELGELAQTRKEKNIQKKTRKTEDFFNLTPIIDFDAVFIPDEAKVVGQIIPTFQYRDVNKTSFLGISTWNSSALLQRLPTHSEASYFVDVLSLDNPPAEFKAFSEKYQQTYNSKPGVMEATAYDTASVIRSLFKSDSAQISRTDLKDELMQVKNYAGVTGSISFADGEFARALRVFEVDKGQIKEVRGGKSSR